MSFCAAMTRMDGGVAVLSVRLIHHRGSMGEGTSIHDQQREYQAQDVPRSTCPILVHDARDSIYLCDC